MCYRKQFTTCESQVYDRSLVVTNCSLQLLSTEISILVCIVCTNNAHTNTSILRWFQQIAIVTVCWNYNAIEMYLNVNYFGWNSFLAAGDCGYTLHLNFYIVQSLKKLRLLFHKLIDINNSHDKKPFFFSVVNCFKRFISHLVKSSENFVRNEMYIFDSLIAY